MDWHAAKLTIPSTRPQSRLEKQRQRSEGLHRRQQIRCSQPQPVLGTPGPSTLCAGQGPHILLHMNLSCVLTHRVSSFGKQEAHCSGLTQAGSNVQQTPALGPVVEVCTALQQQK